MANLLKPPTMVFFWETQMYFVKLDSHLTNKAG